MSAIMSSNLFGIISRMSDLIPVLASWNVPTVLPLCINSKVSWSSIGMASMSSSMSCLLFMRLTASSSRVWVLRPRRSTLRRPSFSIWYMSYCETNSAFSPPLRWRGIYLVSSSSAITTPAACMVSCLAALHQLEGLLVVHRDGIDVQLYVVPAVYEVNGELQQGLGPEAEEIDLEKAELLDLVHVVLRNQLSVLSSLTLERHILGEFVIGNHDAGRMYGVMPCKPFEATGGIDYLTHF